MKIFITKSFKKKYLSRYSFLNLHKFIYKLKSISSINLKYPYFKFRLNILNVNFRWVFVLLGNGDIVLLVLCLKNDKNCGYNIIWENFSKEILTRQKLALKDIEFWNYEIF